MQNVQKKNDLTGNLNSWCAREHFSSRACHGSAVAFTSSRIRARENFKIFRKMFTCLHWYAALFAKTLRFENSLRFALINFSHKMLPHTKNSKFPVKSLFLNIDYYFKGGVTIYQIILGGVGKILNMRECVIFRVER